MKKQEISDYDVRMTNEIARFFESPAGKYLTAQFMFEREIIISKGKKQRCDEEKMKYWAELDGFDLAVSKWQRMKQHIEIYLQRTDGVLPSLYGLGGENRTASLKK